MTAHCTDNNLIILEGVDGPYPFTVAGDGKEPPDVVQPFKLADGVLPEGSSNKHGKDKAEGEKTRRVRGSDDVPYSDENDDVDAGQATLPLDYPSGLAFVRSPPPFLDASPMKRHVILRRGLGLVKGFGTRRAHA